MKVLKMMSQGDMDLSDMLIEDDSFYGGISIAPEHFDAWRKEFNTEQKAEDSLVEEMAELIQAINKQRRNNTNKNKDAIREEMAHVLISLKGLCRYKMITPGEIEKQIQAKWPAAYTKSNGQCPEKCEWASEHVCLDGSVYQCHCSRVAHTTVDIDTCKHCRFFVEREKEES